MAGAVKHEGLDHFPILDWADPAMVFGRPATTLGRSPVLLGVAGSPSTSAVVNGTAGSELLQQLRELVFHGGAPDVVSFRLRVQVVGPERVGKEDALIVK